MPSKIFESILIEKIVNFKQSFETTAKQVFYDEKTEKLIHPGEFGEYREAICRDFVRFFVPHRLDIGSGFLINKDDSVSTQVDIIIYDAKSTPLIENEERQRFFPIETVVAVGEVKSDLQKQPLKEALNKLSKVKRMKENLNNPVIIRREHEGHFSPKNYYYDQIFSFLICKKLDFGLENITSELDTFYEDDIEKRNKHNMILSIEDGIILYYDNAGKSFMYPVTPTEGALKNRFVKPSMNVYVHFKLFSDYLFLACSSATILYPEITDYMGSIEGGENYDQL